MDSLNWLVPLLVIVPALYIIRRILVMRALSGLKHGNQRIEPIPENAIPVWLTDITRAQTDALAAHGFTYRRSLRLTSPNGPDFDVIYSEYTLPGEGIRALVQPYEAGVRPGECHATLRSTLADGTVLATTTLDYQEARIAPDSPRLRTERHPEADTATLLQYHRARITAAATERSANAITHTSADDDLAQDQALLDEQDTALRASGLVRTGNDGTLRLRPRGLLRFANLAISTAAYIKKREKLRLQNPSPPPLLTPETWSAIEWRHYRQLDTLQRQRLTWLPKLLLMLVSLALFMLALHWIMSPTLAITLVIALTVHECGHLLGMRLFGHRDTQLLFLPFFGGAAVAHDPLVLAPWKHLVILFLGPLPGIFIGIGMMLWSTGDPTLSWIWDAGLLTLIFNAFNLLPILPLDGGQIADVALLSRVPHFRALFMILSALGLIALGALSGGAAIILTLLGLFMLIRTPVEWKLAGLVKRLRAELPPGTDEETAVRRLLADLRGPNWKLLNSAPNAPIQRLQHARALQERVRRPKSGWGAVVLALLGYTSLFWLGLPMMVVIGNLRGNTEIRAAESRADAAGLPVTKPRPTFALVADADNAALPLLRTRNLAPRLWADETGTPEAETEAKQQADNKNTIDLLREAARLPRFALPPAELDHSSYPITVTLQLLQTKVADLQRYNQPDDALALAIDGLRVLRHLQTAPGWWSWSQHTGASSRLWRQVEDLLAQGASVSKDQLQQLATCANEQALIDFAAQAIFAEKIAHIALWRDKSTNDADDTTPTLSGGGIWRVFAWMYEFSPTNKRERARSLDDAIRLRGTLAEISAGRWTPKPPQTTGDTNDTEEWDSHTWTLDNLADTVARQRLYRAALAAHWTMKTKATPNPPATLDDIRAPWLPSGTTATAITHPVTGAPLRLEQRGKSPVLVLASLHLDYTLHNSDAKPELVWRLPPAR
ncbi:site-2 protease family protein [Geminisphaera colitermitum]|uniref:site-2 protease family protein n=1 Tax=Geminisphaera colitermitum TaxID=1148786 RepID=UPI000158D3CA|nr:site-2 protease family protein [Geminisphaera colitermitum]